MFAIQIDDLLFTGIECKIIFLNCYTSFLFYEWISEVNPLKAEIYHSEAN